MNTFTPLHAPSNKLDLVEYRTVLFNKLCKLDIYKKNSLCFRYGLYIPVGSERLNIPYSSKACEITAFYCQKCFTIHSKFIISNMLACASQYLILSLYLNEYLIWPKK